MSLRVLLSDDDDLLRRLYASILMRAGHVVIEAANGEALLVAAEQDDFDVIVTDVVMPGISGLDAALRIHAARPGLKIVLITAFPDAGIEQRAREAGFLLVRKPLPPADLLALVG
jgi:CheY-like chemotaxis protein